jgi:transcriptional regulator with XRE-family HTH domain
MADFKWTKTSDAVAADLAEGYTQAEVAARNGVSDRTIRRWLTDAEFSEEVDNLSLMVGIAHRGARLRLVQRVVRARISKDGVIATEKDVLDWLKYAQSETDGIKLNLDEAFNAAAASLAGHKQTEDDRTDGEDSQGT